MCRKHQIRGLAGRTGRWRRALVAVCALGMGGAPLIAQPAILLEADPDQAFYREGSSNEIYVQARIRPTTSSTAESGDQNRPVPVRNVTFVIDRSGSMDGERMQAMRNALAGALDALVDRDVASIVLFGSEVETLIEAQSAGQARERFSRLGPIEAAGGAALYDGLGQGAAQVRRHAGAGTVNQLILVTDGAATKGPREREDFVRLVETFTREGTAVSAIGLGDEFDEDLLSELARIGGGRFHFADVPEKLTEALLAEVEPWQPIVATDLVLTMDYKGICDDVRSRGAGDATVEKNTVTIRFPRLTEGQELSALASGKLEYFRTFSIQRDLVRVRLSWTDPSSGESHELAQTVTVRFSPETRDLVGSINLHVYRAAVAAMITDGMQDAIKQIDRGDFRRAVRELRRTRERARDVNFHSDDSEMAAMIVRLEAYIAEVQARGMTLLDRKILRSGLFNQFDGPAVPGDAKK